MAVEEDCDVMVLNLFVSVTKS